MDVNHIPYKGAAPAVQDRLGGQVAMMFDSVMVTNPHLKSGKLRAIAINSLEHNAGASDAFTAHIAEELQRWGRVIRSAGIKGE